MPISDPSRIRLPFSPRSSLDHWDSRRAAIRDKQSLVEVFCALPPQLSQYSVPQLQLWVERFFRLGCRDQWNRERFAPSFHLDDGNLDLQTACRFPILCGGFERELTGLKDYVVELPWLECNPLPRY